MYTIGGQTAQELSDEGEIRDLITILGDADLVETGKTTFSRRRGRVTARRQS